MDDCLPSFDTFVGSFADIPKNTDDCNLLNSTSVLVRKCRCMDLLMREAIISILPQPHDLGVWVVTASVEVTFLIHKEKEAEGVLRGQGSHPTKVTHHYLCCQIVLESGKGLNICNFTCACLIYAHFSLGGSLKRAIHYPGFPRVTVPYFVLAGAEVYLPFTFHSADWPRCL